MDITDLQKYAYLAPWLQVALSFLIGCATVFVLGWSLKLNRQSQELAGMLHKASQDLASELHKSSQEFAKDLHKSSQEFAKQSKQADVLGDFNARYSRIWEMRAKDEIKNNPIVFYERFWSLQLDQFDAWCRGFVPEENFNFWVDSRHDDWVADKSLGTMSYRQGFKETVGQWKGSNFVTFIENLQKDGKIKAIDEVKKAGFPKAW
jgi:hypothetical protein